MSRATKNDLNNDNINNINKDNKKTLSNETNLNNQINTRLSATLRMRNIDLRIGIRPSKCHRFVAL